MTQLLEKNIGEYCYYLRSGKDLFIQDKEKNNHKMKKTDKLDINKIQNVSSSKDIINMIKQARKWKNIFTIHISDKELVSRT